MFGRLESGLFHFGHWIRGPMAGGAIFRRRLIEQNGLSRHHFGQLVALDAAYILMRPAQRECSSLLVVEKRRLPLHAVVALGTARNVGYGELFPVDVLMTVLALCRCGLEVHVDQLGLKIWRFVAVHARRRAVRTQQHEVRLGVVEARKLFPRLRGMTGFASRHGTIGPRLLHAISKLTFMRIAVATGAVEVAPVIHRRFRLELCRFFVAVGAGYRDVAAGQNEAGLLVLRQAEGGRLVGLQIVAAVTCVEVGCCGKLPRMLIGVAVHTALELDFEKGVLAFGNVALCALQPRMRALQWVSAGGVLLHRER